MMNDMHETFAKWDQAAAEVLAEDKPNASIAFDKQVGGNHYTGMAIQPAEYCFANMTPDEIRGAMKWNIHKYVWRGKGGVEDLRKAQHYLEWLIAYEMCNSGD